MRAVLTQAMIEKMPLPAKRKDCRDTRLKGLILRVSPNGVKSFYCEYARGKRVWLGRADALGLAEARERARAILASAYLGLAHSVARKPRKQMPNILCLST